MIVVSYKFHLLWCHKDVVTLTQLNIEISIAVLDVQPV